MSVIAVEKPLREKLGDEGAKALIRLFNDSNEEQKTDIIKFVGEKFERRLTEEIKSLEVRLVEKLANLEVRLSEKIDRGDKALSEKIGRVDKTLSDKIDRVEIKLSEKILNLDVKISSVKSELIKWMFIFWIGQVGMMLGILFAFFKRYCFNGEWPNG